jgi:phosphatidate cytidylyltransferase
MSAYWLTNPFTNPLALPLTLLLLSIFGGAALALQAVHFWRVTFSNRSATKRAAVVPESVLWQRYRTWVIIAILFISATLIGPLAIAILCGFFCWQGGKEYAVLTALPMRHQRILLLASWATLIAVLCWNAPVLTIAPILAFFGWSILTLQPVAEETEVGQRFAIGLTAFWGYLYLGWLPAFLLALSMNRTPGFVLLVGFGVAMSDVAAFCTGKLLMINKKLAPRLSPNKTWGGLLGNLLGAALAIGLTSFALPYLQFWQFGLLIAAIGLGSAWGDLLESLLKRQCGVKDAGALLPGFGGLLDRIDSLLLVAPLVYYVTFLLSANPLHLFFS